MRASRRFGSPCAIIEAFPGEVAGTIAPAAALSERQECVMGRYMLLWLLGVPIPLLALIWVFGGLH
jgi:hypothetical protein